MGDSGTVLNRAADITRPGAVITTALDNGSDQRLNGYDTIAANTAAGSERLPNEGELMAKHCNHGYALLITVEPEC